MNTTQENAKEIIGLMLNMGLTLGDVEDILLLIQHKTVIDNHCLYRATSMITDYNAINELHWQATSLKSE